MHDEFVIYFGKQFDSRKLLFWVPSSQKLSHRHIKAFYERIQVSCFIFLYVFNIFKLNLIDLRRWIVEEKTLTLADEVNTYLTCRALTRNHMTSNYLYIWFCRDSVIVLFYFKIFTSFSDAVAWNLRFSDGHVRIFERFENCLGR